MNSRWSPPLFWGHCFTMYSKTPQSVGEEFTEYFGEEVYTLVDGVTKIDDITIGKGHRKAASLRKMIWAMVDDLRIIFIKLADKCHNMRTLHHIKDERRRQRIARECLEIYAPMASKLGMSSHKSELGRLQFQVLKTGLLCPNSKRYCH